jgi:hypothetical protein
MGQSQRALGPVKRSQSITLRQCETAINSYPLVKFFQGENKAQVSGIISDVPPVARIAPG